MAVLGCDSGQKTSVCPLQITPVTLSALDLRHWFARFSVRDSLPTAETLDHEESIPLAPISDRPKRIDFSMRFSDSLKFNAVAEWWREYINYAVLKKQIYVIEKRQHGSTLSVYRDIEANEDTSLLGHSASSTDHLFKPLLDKELHKITTFYESQERELFDELDILEDQVLSKESQGLRPDGAYLENDGDEDDDDDDDDDLLSPSMDFPQSGSRRRLRSTSHSKSPAARERRRRSSSALERRRSVSSEEGDLEASVAAVQPNLGAIPETSGETQGGRRASWSPTSPGFGTVFPPKPAASTMGPQTRLGKIFKSLVPESAQEQSESIWTSKSNYAFDTRALFKRKITNLYLSFTSLRSYVELNYSGFRKILKKYDKVTYSELKDPYMHNVVDQAYPFREASRVALQEAIAKLVALYAKCVTKGDQSSALKQLRVHQREHIAWERDTVWRQMIGNERRGEEDGQVRSLGDVEIDPLTPGAKSHNFVFHTRFGTLRFKKKKAFLPIAIIVFIAILKLRVVAGVEANNCFAILLFATLLWATEAIPLFVTSLFIPFLLVVFRTIRADDVEHARLSTPDATKFIFSVMFSPTIMLLIGGFTIASALSKTNIDRVLITRVLSLAGKRPNVVLLAFMGVACFASMWISNVAAPTLCFTLIQPILRTLPPKTSFAPCLILGIALAANIGGQSSPISSPQNLIALQYMNPPIDWLQWFAVALPVSFVSVILIWLLLVLSYRPGTTADGEELEIKAIRPTRERFTLKQWWVTLICIVTIGLWCVAHEIEGWVGDMGVIAIIPIVAFFSTGVLKKDDFEQFLWTIVFLAMGGIALGKAVDSSGLLDIIDEFVRHLIDGLSLYHVVLVLSLIVLIVSTFISHTIASVLLVPIAAEVGTQFSEPHPRLLIFLTGLICSTGMGMPVSGFPNQTAANQVDEMGKTYLTNVDFLKNGVPASILAMIVVATVGYILMRAIGL